MNHTKLSPEEMSEIDRRAAAGENHTQIAAATGIKRDIVQWRIDVEFRLQAVNRARRRRGQPPFTLAEYKAASAKIVRANSNGGRARGSILEPVSINVVRVIEPFVGWKAPTCQWISGNPSYLDDCKCGAETVEGFSYCAEHARKAYQPGTSMEEIRRTRRRIPLDSNYVPINPGRLAMLVGAK